ncbi:MAG: hypothetical protein RLZZ621_1038 [Gemmatimonadota bacterium]|jgi:AcrR family transcriptional regulator
MSPSRRKPEVRPLEILEAAFHEFGEHGLAGARLDDIARRANVAKGTIYLYFPNKDALFREMIHSTIIESLASAETTMASADDEDTEALLRLLATRWWHLLRTPRMRTLLRLVQGELHRFPDLMAFYADSVTARGRRLAASIVERGIARGEFRDTDPVIAARMFQGLWLSHAMWTEHAALFGLPDTDDTVLAELLDFFLTALRRPTA